MNSALADLLRPCVVRGEFQLSNVVSDWYMDARQVTYARPDLFGMIIADAVEQNGITFDAIGGPGFGAVPLALGLAVHYGGKRSFAIRGNAKRHGLGGQLVGPLYPDDRALLVDDVVTTGRSLMDAASVVDYVGARPVAALCLLNRGWDVKAFEFGSHHIPLISILYPEDIL